MSSPPAWVPSWNTCLASVRTIIKWTRWTLIRSYKTTFLSSTAHPLTYKTHHDSRKKRDCDLSLKSNSNSCPSCPNQKEFNMLPILSSRNLFLPMSISERWNPIGITYMYTHEKSMDSPLRNWIFTVSETIAKIPIEISWIEIAQSFGQQRFHVFITSILAIGGCILSHIYFF